MEGNREGWQNHRREKANTGGCQGVDTPWQCRQQCRRARAACAYAQRGVVLAMCALQAVCGAARCGVRSALRGGA